MQDKILTLYVPYRGKVWRAKITHEVDVPVFKLSDDGLLAANSNVYLLLMATFERRTLTHCHSRWNHSFENAGYILRGLSQLELKHCVPVGPWQPH